jgi:hypothetical protein
MHGAMVIDGASSISIDNNRPALFHTLGMEYYSIPELACWSVRPTKRATRAHGPPRARRPRFFAHRTAAVPGDLIDFSVFTIV